MTKTENIRVLEVILDHTHNEESKEALRFAINSLKVDEMYQLEKEDTDEFVSLKTFKQVMRERDIAISQLEELGYDFGEEIRQEDEFIPKSVIEDIKAEIEDLDTYFDNDHWSSNKKPMYLREDVLEIIDNHISGKEKE